MRLDGMLAHAAKSGHEEAVRWLLGVGESVHDDEYSGMSPVLSADATPAIANLLLARGARPPTLEAAAWANAPNTFRRLLADDPHVAKTNSAILHAAAGSFVGAPEDKRLMVTKLLDLGADANAMFGYDSPLGAAVSTCGQRASTDEIRAACMSIVRLLLDHGANVKGDALADALSLDEEYRAAPLEALLERPIDKGVTSKALAEATSVAPEDLQRILKLGVDWNWHDGEEDAAAPLLGAVKASNRDYARALIDAGAPVDVHFKDGSCALAQAIDNVTNSSDNARIVELLVTRGANVNRRLPDGRTPLYAAAESGDIRVVNFLLAHGASVNDLILDETALDAAENHQNVPAARVLHAHGGHAALRRAGRTTRSNR